MIVSIDPTGTVRSSTAECEEVEGRKHMRFMCMNEALAANDGNMAKHQNGDVNKQEWFWQAGKCSILPSSFKYSTQSRSPLYYCTVKLS